MIRPPGQPVDFTLRTFSDEAETVPLSPTAATLTFTGPTGVPGTPITWPGGTITNPDPGVLSYVATFTPGHWSGLWVTTGAVATSSAFAFDVADQAPYVNPADVRSALAGSATLPGTAAALSDDDLFEAIYEAQAEVNGRLEGRGYTTPMIDTAGLVVQITRNVAAYVATLTYRRGNPIQPGDPVLLRYQRAQGLLKDISSGALPLAVPAGGGTDAASSENVAVSNPIDGDLWNACDFDLRPQVPSWAGWPR